ncbi:MAG TPA: glycosyltransferase [Patescibacteria group bacterium]|nr:glycosyltransferase [Patescibacteria group bacterium]
MKVAIVHDYIKDFGGAERVLIELHRLYPEAPVYTTIYAPSYLGPHRKEFEDIEIKTSFLNVIPYREKLISIFRLISPFVFANMNLSKFDVIIVSQTGAYFPNLVKKGRAQLICYTHTPPRYLYGYMTARDWQRDRLMRFFGLLANHFLRMADFRASQNVDFFIANSEEIAARIKKFYRRDSVVINPPVDLNRHSELDSESHNEIPKQVRGDKNYYLCGGRLARAKGIDVIIRAFNENGKKLKIFGRGFAGYDEELKLLAKKNIEFVGEVTDDERINLMAGARAYIFASYDEDFGITPVESQGLGTPVIAYKSGGVKETVIDGKTGIFYDENTSKKLNEAINKFEMLKQVQHDKMRKTCKVQAQKFSSEVFDRKIKQFISNLSSRT